MATCWSHWDWESVSHSRCGRLCQAITWTSEKGTDIKLERPCALVSHDLLLESVCGSRKVEVCSAAKVDGLNLTKPLLDLEVPYIFAFMNAYF